MYEYVVTLVPELEIFRKWSWKPNHCYSSQHHRPGCQPKTEIKGLNKPECFNFAIFLWIILPKEKGSLMQQGVEV